MKKFLANVANKVADVANEVAAYNDPSQSALLAAKHNSAKAGAGAAQGPGHAPGAAGGGPESVLADPVIGHLLQHVRSKHVRQHFAKTPPAEYMRRKQVSVLAASFNVNGKKPPPGLRLDEWLGVWRGKWPAPPADAAAAGQPSQPQSQPQCQETPDVVAVGFQEIVPLNAGNVMGGARAARWVPGRIWGWAGLGRGPRGRPPVVLHAVALLARRTVTQFRQRSPHYMNRPMFA